MNLGLVVEELMSTGCGEMEGMVEEEFVTKEKGAAEGALLHLDCSSLF
jgi:hypothetical protein